MRHTVFLSAALCGLLASSTAQTAGPLTQGDPGPRQSVLSGRTLGQGSTAFHGQVGWPGIEGSLLYGAGPRLDVGIKGSLLYGYEGITAVSGVPGMKMQGVFRLGLLERGKINFGLRFSPGFFFYFFNGYTQPGLTLPIDLMLGFSVAPNLMMHVGLDFPIFVAFGEYGGLVVPVMAGGGMEYFIDRNLGLTFNLRAGPSALLTNYYYPYDYYGSYCYDDLYGRTRCGRRTFVAAEILIGLSYKF